MARLRAWALLVAILLFITSQPATCEDSEMFHIIPSANSPCPGRLTGEPCITLSQYTSGEYRQYTSDPSGVVLEFQPGRHTARGMSTSQFVSFTMVSENSTKIDCYYSLYLITNVQNVHISGIDFVRCHLRIESVMNFILEKSSFSDMSDYSFYVLYIKSSSATIKGCNFTNNSPLPLHIDNSSTELHHTNFVNNKRDNNYIHRRYDGGGALLIENTQSIVTISHCSFIGNSAYYRGGAIFTSSSLFIQQSSFMNNQVSRKGDHGGAIYVAGFDISLSINRSEFINNRIYGDGNGGAIYAASFGISLSINQSEFTNNRLYRAGHGGAIYVNGNNSLVSIYQSTMKENKARIGSGGAVFLTGNDSHILITESTINKNSGAKCGALSITDGRRHRLKLVHSMLTNNSAITGSGGVICIRNASISILNSTFNHNSATGKGGVFAVDDSAITIHSSTFYNNTAGANGGVLNSEYFHISLFISHTSFMNNQAAIQGGVMFLGRKGSEIEISMSTISFNNATRGAFATVLGSSLEITTSNVLNNTGEIISSCNSDILVSDQLITATNPVYSVCTLYSGDVNDYTNLEVTTMTTPVDTTTTASKTTTVTMSSTTSQHTEPSMTTSVYFELNGKAYSNNSIIPLSEVGENENALLCKTDLVTCCGTPPNRFGEFYYPNGDTVSVKKAGHGFYRDRGVQEVRLNRKEGVTSPTGKFHCAVPDASGMIQNLYIHLLSEETMQP